MGRYLGLRVGTTESVESLKNLFDLDFTENEEYYREDTLSLGFKDEAERIIHEFTNEDGTYDLEAIVGTAFEGSYYLSYQYEITEVENKSGEKIYVVSVAYMNQ